jgi:hypothetical protein
VKFLWGIFYLFTAAAFTLHFYTGAYSIELTVILCTVLIAKGVLSLLLKQSMLSILDTATGLYFLMLAVAIFPNNIATVVFLIYLLQKGVSYILRGFS